MNNTMKQIEIMLSKHHAPFAQLEIIYKELQQLYATISEVEKYGANIQVWHSESAVRDFKIDNKYIIIGLQKKIECKQYEANAIIAEYNENAKINNG